MAKRKQYVVANPRGIPEGVCILRTESKEFYEGDPITAADVGAGVLKLWVERGFIVEAD